MTILIVIIAFSTKKTLRRCIYTKPEYTKKITISLYSAIEFELFICRILICLRLIDNRFDIITISIGLIVSCRFDNIADTR